MKKNLLALIAVVVAVVFTSGSAYGLSKEYLKRTKVSSGSSTSTYEAPKPAPEPEKSDPEFPEKGWHKGAYLTGNVGMMQVTNDSHSVYNRKFDGTFDLSFGLTFGWDILDWIGPMLQINYATATGQVGDPNNVAAAVTYGGNTYSAGTFPLENAREHAIDIGLYARVTHPYFMSASWQPKSVKIIPYGKIGGIGHAVYVNAPTSANKAGALGGGIGLGAGCEFYIWKGLFFAVDFTEGIIFQKGFKKNITDSGGVARNVSITKSGTIFQFNVQGLFGWHF
ncbi:MAG: hypothetical protein HN337_10170 [Deltaproteobacteria bacterium]|nr:hypothetical protein [Deltaproteobacteria bacterium]